MKWFVFPLITSLVCITMVLWWHQHDLLLHQETVKRLQTTIDLQAEELERLKYALRAEVRLAAIVDEVMDRRKK